MRQRILKISVTFCLLLLIQACGRTHIKPIITSDLNQYTHAYISEINIKSKEKNSDALEINENMKAYTHDEFKKFIKKERFRQATSSDFNALEFKVDVDIIYGSRALRYWVGFGAGKGIVKSTFEAIDSHTGEVKYSASGASHLIMGFLGGSMKKVIRNNIHRLLAKFYIPKEQLKDL